MINVAVIAWHLTKDVEMQKEEKALREYAESQGKNYSPYRYITEFENVYPDIASKYYDMKWT